MTFWKFQKRIQAIKFMAAIVATMTLLATGAPQKADAGILGGALAGALVGGLIGGKKGARTGAVIGGIAGAIRR